MICVKCKKEIQDGSLYCNLCGKKQSTETRKHKKRANNTGNISKLSGNRAKPWLARKNGVSIGTFSTRGEAQRALERLVDIDVNAKFNMTFSDVYEAWLPEHEREITEKGTAGYKSAYKHCTDLHGKKYRSLRTSDFQMVIINMERRGLSKSTCEKVLQLFGQLSAWAMREDIIHKDYSRYVNTVAKQKSEGIVLKDSTIKNIKKSKNKAADIVLIMLGSGCRPNELFNALTANCYDTYFIGGSKTATGRNRVIPVAPIGRDRYRKILEKAREQGSEKLIDGYDGNRGCHNFSKREFKELVEEVGEAFTPYDCRHTFATWAKRSGVDPQILRRILGHASLTTTDQYYTHLDADDILSKVDGIKVGL